jgi:hypothetical protein
VSLDTAHPMMLHAEHAASSTCRVGAANRSAVAANLRVPWSLAAIERLTQPVDADEARDVSELHIILDVLTPAGRRDLANPLLRAAWSAVLEETRILLLDLLMAADDTTPTEAR